jgi:hypothetical protein
MNLLAAVRVLDEFLLAEPLTNAIATLEHALNGADRADAARAAADASVTPELLAAALTVRAKLGRVNDLVHAAGIALVLPHLLEEGEHITTRPSLAARNDSTRPCDLRTDRRAAEFKFAQWKGADATRKRQTFKDLVLLPPLTLRAQSCWSSAPSQDASCRPAHPLLPEASTRPKRSASCSRDDSGH